MVLKASRRRSSLDPLYHLLRGPAAPTVLALAAAIGAAVAGAVDITRGTTSASLLFMLASQAVIVVAVLDLNGRLLEDADLDADVKQFCRSSGDIIRTHLEKLHEDHQTSLRINHTEGYYVVTSKTQALETYHDYWEILGKRQSVVQELVDRGERVSPWLVRAVHSTSIEVWKDESVLEVQRRFTREGGQVIRILASSEPTPGEDYVNVAKRMIDAGISVRYLVLGASAFRMLQKFDFMLVGKSDNRIDSNAIVWEKGDTVSGDGLTGRPMKAYYSRRPSHGSSPDLNEVWESLFLASSPFGK